MVFDTCHRALSGAGTGSGQFREPLGWPRREVGSLRKKQLTIRLSGGRVLGMMLALGVAPATAHASTTTCVYQGSDGPCATEYVNESDLAVCDNEADGNGAYAEFRGYWPR